MEKNCLQTKLMGVVTNDKLPKIGELTLIIDSETQINTNIFKQGNNPVELRASSGVTVIGNGTIYPKFTGNGYAFVKEKNSIVGLITSSGVNSPYISLQYDDLKYCTSLQTLNIYNNNVVGLDIIEKLDVLPLIGMVINNYTLGGTLTNCENLKNSLEQLNIKNITGLQSTLSILAQFKALEYIKGWDSTVFSGALEDFVSHRYILGEDYKNGSLTISYPHYNTNITFLDVSIVPMGQGVLQWSVIGDNVIVSFGEDTTVIHVNSDASWNRVS